MGKPLTIQAEDDERIESLKKPLGAHTKIEVLRRALDSLEDQIRRRKRRERLVRASKIVAKESARVNKEFQAASLLKKEWL